MRSPAASGPRVPAGRSGASVRTSISALSAATLWREIASDTTISTSTTSMIGQPLGALQPGQLDQFGDHVAQPVGLDQHLLGEPADGFGVVRGRQQRLGEQRHRADRGLELMADVGHEVTPGRLHPGIVGLVVDEHHGEPAVFLAQQPGMPVHREPGAAGGRALARRQVELGVVAAASACCAACQAWSSSCRSRTRPSSLARSLMVDDVAMGIHHRGAQVASA